jgi:hypothetical protein
MQTIEPLNTIPLQQFIQQVKAAENSRSKEVKLTIEQAKNLAFTIGIVMSRLEGDLEKLISNAKSGTDDVIQVQIGSNSSW